MLHACCAALVCLLPAQAASPKAESVDLLIVGGTESGVAAAVQAARMGVKSILLVNDITWLGGQFTAEGLCAIDENRARSGTNETPFPRSGLFREVTARIEAFNREKYGTPRPGNTIVATTCRPRDTERLFRELVQPYVDRGQLRIVSGYYPVAAEVEGDRLLGLRFAPVPAVGGAAAPLAEGFTVRARLTIDASDFGEAIQAAGASFECGPDAKSKYGEPHAFDDPVKYPHTELNPITWCLIIEQTNREEPIARPAHFDDRRYFLTTNLTEADYRKLAWPFPPHRPFAPLWAAGGANTVYTSRRLVDAKHLKLAGETGDVILLNWTIQNYPTDVWPKWVADALEQTEAGASRKNLVELTRAQRQIVFDDAKAHALGMLYHLQTTAHDRLPEGLRPHTFRRFRLSDEFGTPDRLPPKPYLRESLRLKAMYMMREQETLNDNKTDEFAHVMYFDSIAAWQFEYDYHPTGRMFLPDEGPAGPWAAYGKRGRGWGVYSDRAVFPLRSLIPERFDGLLGAQKNLGYSSQVCSAVRLHDQSLAIGQAAGATAAVALRHGLEPRAIVYDRSKLTEVRRGLVARTDAISGAAGAVPAVLYPFRDLSPDQPAYPAVQLLAASGALPHARNEVDFRPAAPAEPAWRAEVARRSLTAKQVKTPPAIPAAAMTRGEFAIAWQAELDQLPDAPIARQTPDDADGDGTPDLRDPQPLDPTVDAQRFGD